jgi:hypothetical protein
MRSVFFNDERKWHASHPFDDVLQVGTAKAVGYVCTEETPDITADKLVLVRSADDSIYSRTFWVCDRLMAQAVLDKHSATVTAHGWPMDARRFFVRLVFEDIPHNALYHVVCDLFNSWCLHCEPPPVWRDGVAYARR